MDIALFALFLTVIVSYRVTRVDIVGCLITVAGNFLTLALTRVNKTLALTVVVTVTVTRNCNCNRNSDPNRNHNRNRNRNPNSNPYP